MQLKHFAVLVATVLTSASLAHAVVAPPSSPDATAAPTAEVEDARVAARTEANGDQTKWMDESTPAELAADLGFEDEDPTPEAAATQSPLIVIDVNITTQRMNVATPDGPLGPFKVSTSNTKRGYPDAVGTFPINPNRMYVQYNSVQYDDASMPYAMFYHNGYAVHATFDNKHLGQPASHGCVRLSLANARLLFSVVQPLVKANGLGSAIIRVHY